MNAKELVIQWLDESTKHCRIAREEASKGIAAMDWPKFWMNANLAELGFLHASQLQLAIIDGDKETQKIIEDVEKMRGF